MRHRGLGAMLWLVGVIIADGVLAQGVYVTRGANGPVFSDKPNAGAKEMTLRPLTVVPATRPSREAPLDEVTPPARDEAKKESAAPVYRSLVIASPQDGGSVAANSAMEVRLIVEPPLLLGDGHAFAVAINGRQVSQRFTATEFSLPAAFWDGGLPPANQPMQLEVSIVDGNGKRLFSATPVRFTPRYVVIRPAYRVHPHPPPRPPHAPPAPREKAPKEVPMGGGVIR